MPPHPCRLIAVDWSGARTGAAAKIWLCEVRDGAVVRLERGRSREALVDVLLGAHREAREVGDALVAGLDFAFSFPAWAFERTGFDSAPELWALARARGEHWLTGPRWPFWRTARPDDIPAHTRRTEREAGERAGRAPSSVFKLVGADQVGAGSVRGMALLPTLRAAGMAVWPFDDARPDGSTLLEIWPRLYYRTPLAKSRAEARAAYLARHHADLPAWATAAAAGSDDAFDALVSALAMWEARDELGALPPARDATERREGRIWAPTGVPTPRADHPIETDDAA